LAQPLKIPALAKEASEWLEGRVDVLINNAGVGYHCPIDSVIPEEAVEVMNVNALAPIILTSSLLPALYNAPRPKVINISSILGVKPLPLTATYTASKHALNGYSQVLRLETAERGLSVTIIEPGAIDTPFLDKTHDPVAVERMGRRNLTKLSPHEVCRWVLTVIESPPYTCPEVIRVAPMGQAI
jgi:short-subunit dehydrogenase